MIVRLLCECIVYRDITYQPQSIPFRVLSMYIYYDSLLPEDTLLTSVTTLDITFTYKNK